ncbi:tetratricopeptide repeat-containing glycosyltransferase family protein [Paraburkholderia sp. SIMBA_055]
MSDSAVAAPAVMVNVTTRLETVHLLWSILREEGFEPAISRAAELAAAGVTPQLHADLHASAGNFELAYHSASQAQAGENGARHARVALFADALGRGEVARHYSELAVAAQPPTATLEWAAWLINDCGAHSAAAHMLRAYRQRKPEDAHGPWWLAISLGALSGPGVRDERRTVLAQAYTLDPAVDPALPLQLALALREARDWAALEHLSRDMLTRNPADAEMAWQLSHAQWQCNDAAAAEATMRAANAASPGNADVLAAIGFYLCEQARYEESEAMLHQALAANPHAVTPAVDLADLELRRGSWTSGWKRFEARLARDDREPNNIVSVMARLCPRRRGETLAGKTLVVHSELGNGDDIHMVRYVPQLAARVRAEGGRLVLCVRKSLQPLLGRFYEDCVSIEDGPLGAPDYSLPMMSLPLVLNLQPEQVRGGAYLRADPGKAALWRERLRAHAPQARLHVGLVWAGSPTHRRDDKRSIARAALEPLLSLADVAFYSLTPGRAADVAVMTAQGHRVFDMTADYQTGFDDVAAHLMALDALVTIDSAPLHLGGALGRPVLGMLDHVSHWAWGNEETQAWYDSLELFRQPQPGQWAPVVERVTARLQTLMAEDASNVVSGAVAHPVANG